VRARVQGYLDKIHFKEGTEVKKGELLYEIDPRTFEADVQKAKADLARQQAQETLAVAQLDRADRLRGTSALSPEDYQQLVAAREQARAAVQQARAALRSAELQLGFTKIRAPISGRISRTLVTEGNLVGAGSPTLLTTIVSMDPIYVYFEVPERGFLDYQRLIREKGAASAAEAKVPVHVGLETEPDKYPHEGIIKFRDNRVDPGTGTVLLRGELPNPDRLLTPGLFVRIRVPIGKPRPRLLVPETAISADQRGRYVLVVRSDDTVEQRYITEGSQQPGNLTVVDGIKASDRIVVNGIQRARPGAKVTPQEQTSPTRQRGAT
jgi:RND family efflux transporter MFP subunit